MLYSSDEFVMHDIYNIDMLKAEVFGFYLDKNFYNKAGNDFFIVRSSSIAEQKRGIDLRLSSKKLKLDNVIVDEKCSFYYMNGGLDSFSLELSRISGDGWFLSDYCETEYYLLAWPYGDKDFDKHIKELFSNKEQYTNINDFIKHCRENGKLPHNDITGAEVMLISKFDIIDGLGEVLQQDRKAVLEFLKKQSSEMRHTDYRKEKKSSFVIQLGEGIKIKKSFCWWKHCSRCRDYSKCKGSKQHTKKTEPVNLIINKKLLGSWASYKAVVGHQTTGEEIPVAWKTLNETEIFRNSNRKPKRRPYLELYNEGLSISEIAKYNRVKMATVHRHLVQNLAEGKVDRKRLMGEYRFKMSDNRFNQIMAYIQDKDLSFLKPLVTDAPFTLEYWEVGLVRSSILAEKLQK